MEKLSVVKGAVLQTRCKTALVPKLSTTSWSLMREPDLLEDILNFFYFFFNSIATIAAPRKQSQIDFFFFLVPVKTSSALFPDH